MAWLTLQDVTVALGGKDVVCNVSAEVNAGELIVVVGPNGAGKTSLLRSLAGLVPARTGAIRVMGADPARWSRKTTRARARVPAAAVRSRVPVCRW